VIVVRFSFGGGELFLALKRWVKKLAQVVGVRGSANLLV
jgi:hypothetical protein